MFYTQNRVVLWFACTEWRGVKQVLIGCTRAVSRARALHVLRHLRPLGFDCTRRLNRIDNSSQICSWQCSTMS